MAERANDGKKLVVIGAGPGGYPAAYLAAHHGLNVTLIDERAKQGGVCLNVGCIPSKALLHVARVLNESHESADWGVTFAKPRIDLDRLRAWKDQVIGKMTGGLGAMTKAHKITFLQGRARFSAKNTVEVEAADGRKHTLDFDAAIIATGSNPARPGPLALQSRRVMDSTAALDLPEIPKTLLVIGGGYIGLEMGSVYAALGSKVSVVEMLSGLLPGADRDLADALQKQLAKRFDRIMLDTRVTDMSEAKGGVKVKLLGVDLSEEQTYDRVIVSVGRVPNTRDLGLEKIEVEPDTKGFINTDNQMRTAAPNVYAIGDIVAGPGLAHKATHEGRVAVEAILGKPTAFDPNAIPAVVFTDPEVAWAGLTENDCRDKGIDHKVARFPWVASGRATTLGRSDGLTKIIVDPLTDRLLGVGIVGVSAGDLIAEAALALEMGATATDLARTIHPHPTTSETLMEAAELYHGHSAHFIARK